MKYVTPTLFVERIDENDVVRTSAEGVRESTMGDLSWGETVGGEW